MIREGSSDCTWEEGPGDWMIAGVFPAMFHAFESLPARALHL